MTEAAVRRIIMPHKIVGRSTGTYLEPEAGESAVIKTCLRRILQTFRPQCVFLTGSFPRDSQAAQDIDFCVVVTDLPNGRLRWHIAGVTADIFVERTDSLERQIATIRPQHIISIVAGGRYLYGDKTQAARLQAAARAVASRPAPLPDAAARFRFETQPFDLLRKFHRARVADVASATFILSRLVNACIDAFFGETRLWTVPPDRVVEALRNHDRQYADALSDVLLSPPKSLCENPAPVIRMVDIFAGKENLFTMSSTNTQREWVS